MYRDGLKSGPVLLSYSQAGQGRNITQPKDHFFSTTLYIFFVETSFFKIEFFLGASGDSVALWQLMTASQTAGVANQDENEDMLGFLICLHIVDPLNAWHSPISLTMVSKKLGQCDA